MEQRNPSSKYRAARLLRAVTLLEIMVVVAIVGILATLALPRLDGITARMDRQGDIIIVEDALKRARNLARNSRRCVEVAVDGQNVTFTAFTSCAMTGPQPTTTLTLKRAIPCAFDTGDGKLVYQPDGSITATTAARIRTVEKDCVAGPSLATLRVFPITGITKRVKGTG